MQEYGELLQRYANVTVRVGLNLQPGQTLLVMAPVAGVEFVREVVKQAYGAGARHVYVDWEDEQVTKLRYQLEPEVALQEFPAWRVEQREQLAAQGAAFLTIHAGDPDLLLGVDARRIGAAKKAGLTALAKYREDIQNMRVSWLVVSIPTQPWAAKVFPEGTSAEQVARLWQAIFKATRVDGGDPVIAWGNHIKDLHEKANFLNEQRFKRLHYRGPGTDLKIELPERHLWISAESTNDQGTVFVPNMPTEEVFTLPYRTGVEGVVTSSMPLNHDGVLVENLSLTFRAGRVVDFSADSGYDTLKEILDADEGSRYLGEVALVPQNSPIANMGTLFYNTLFDENASCHLAIGSAYPVCLEGGAQMNREMLDQRGVNHSVMHVDFMIGSAQLNIDGETHDGRVVPVFRNGNWASQS
ncbi:aminopeptidase [Alicyclobacillaceae bacterium I2511]|nr:aminopeptidase [Alicyclobacillaceae bacterium I2511]